MSRTDRIAADAVLGKFHRHGTGQRHDAAFGCAVDGTAAQHPGVVVRADIYDIPGLVPVHFPRHCLTDKEQPLEIGIHNAVVGFGRHIQEPLPLIDPRDIEQHVDLSVLRRHLVYAGVDAVQIGNIQPVCRSGSAGCGDLIHQRSALFQIPAAQSHRTSGSRQPAADRIADAAGRTRYQNDFPLQSENGVQICTRVH